MKNKNTYKGSVVIRDFNAHNNLIEKLKINMEILIRGLRYKYYVKNRVSKKKSLNGN